MIHLKQSENHNLQPKSFLKKKMTTEANKA